MNFSNVGKRLFPTGFTKGEMLQYYVGIARFILPHLHDRPITLIRFPDGTRGESFYEKNAPRFAPEWIRTFKVPRRGHEGHINYILVNDAETLAWCANLAAIEFHPFLHRVPELDRPTHVAFDLDPGDGADVFTCAEVAFLLKDIFDALGLKSFPKVSGSKGLQLYVPLNTPTSYAATQPFAKAVAELLARQHPKLVVSEMPKELRKGRVLIDWSQNSQSKTTVAVYSLRAKRDEPLVSMPVGWTELEQALKRRRVEALMFSPNAARQRLEKRGDLFAPVLTLKQRLPEAFLKLPPMPTASSSLRRYAEKRDFSRTREPGPAVPRGSRQGSTRRFVIQKHAARNLHYDFRLEMGDALKSWAVPKGVPYELGVRRAAFQVEDHPIDYLDFEGTIPAGQYGGGTVMVWDIGTYELIGGSYEQGDLKLWLAGRKLKGEWHVFRIKTEENKPVWLIQKGGEPMRALSAKQDDRSALTGRTMARIASDNDAQWQSNRGTTTVADAAIDAATATGRSTGAGENAPAQRGKTRPAPSEAGATSGRRSTAAADQPRRARQRASIPAAGKNRRRATAKTATEPVFIEPMQPVLVTELPDGPEWRYEIKWDGFRAIGIKSGAAVRLLSRKHKSLAAEFPSVVKQLRGLEADSVAIDGEVVAITKEGKPSFQALQNRGHSATIVFYAFDLLHLDGEDLTNRPLVERQDRLTELVHGSEVLVSRALEGDARKVLAAVHQLGLEGVVAKRRDSIYTAGERTRDWQKVRLALAQEFVIGGFKPGMKPFESVLVGCYDGGQLRFAGKVRPGFTARTRAAVWKLIEREQTDRCPFVDLPDAERKGRWGEGITAEDMKALRWVKPKHVVRISFTEWTRHGHLRHAAFEGIRPDKNAREVVRESGKPTA